MRYRKQLDVLAMLQQKLDTEAQKRVAFSLKAKGLAVSPCKAGCYHCCRLWTMVSVPEAVGCIEVYGRKRYLARQEERSEEWARQLKSANDPETTSKSWFRERHDCVFLKAGRCEVYKSRPAACRLHSVLTPPELCAGTSDDYQVASIDQTIVFIKAQVALSALARSMGLIGAGDAPMPIALEVAQKYVFHGTKQANERLRFHRIDTLEGTLSRWERIEAEPLVRVPLFPEQRVRR